MFSGDDGEDPRPLALHRGGSDGHVDPRPTVRPGRPRAAHRLPGLPRRRERQRRHRGDPHRRHGLPEPRPASPDANEWGPVWSPDGRRIAYSSDENGMPQLFVMDADGSNARQLSDIWGEYPTWSPDGSRIAFASSMGGSTPFGDPDYDVFVIERRRVRRDQPHDLAGDQRGVSDLVARRRMDRVRVHAGHTAVVRAAAPRPGTPERRRRVGHARGRVRSAQPDVGPRTAEQVPRLVPPGPPGRSRGIDRDRRPAHRSAGRRQRADRGARGVFRLGRALSPSGSPSSGPSGASGRPSRRPCPSTCRPGAPCPTRCARSAASRGRCSSPAGASSRPT